MKSAAYRNYLLGVLLVFLAFNYVERHTFALLLQNIKVELALSDTQLGFLTGIAFALFYSVVGLPIARWADRGNRVTIIGGAAALSGAAVALCGVAGSFLPLLLIRIAVGVGEAGCVPPAHSLIADYFSRGERPKAVAIYKLGAPVSVVIGYLLAGWLNELYGWRMTFVLMGLPGVGLAALAWLTLKEPRFNKPVQETGTPAADGFSSPAQPGLKEVFTTLWNNATYRHLLFAYAVTVFFSTGSAQWKPAFFMRSFGLQTGELGAWLAVIYGGGGLLGTYLGGVLASRYAANNERRQLRVMAVLYCFFAAFLVGTYLSTDYRLAFGLMGVGIVGGAMANGPLFATIQTLVPDRMRAMSIAILFLFANLIGMGLGPLAAGALSDLFRLWVGEESLRYALLTLSPGYVWCAWLFWRASKTVTADLEAAQVNAQ